MNKSATVRQRVEILERESFARGQVEKETNRILNEIRSSSAEQAKQLSLLNQHLINTAAPSEGLIVRVNTLRDDLDEHIAAVTEWELEYAARYKEDNFDNRIRALEFWNKLSLSLAALTFTGLGSYLLHALWVTVFP